MKIILTKKETKSLLNIMESVESGSVTDIKKSFKDNSKISYHILSDKCIELDVNPDYVEDFLKLYEKFIPIFVPQVKALYSTALLFENEVSTIIAKY